MKFDQRKAAQFTSTSTDSIEDFSCTSEEENLGGSRGSAKELAFPKDTSRSQPLSENKTASPSSVIKHQLDGRRRRLRQKARGMRGRSSLRVDLISSLEALLSRDSTGIIDQDSLRTLVKVLQEGEATTEGMTLESSPDCSSQVMQMRTTSDTQLEMSGET